MSRLNDLYKSEIRKSLREKFGYKNEMEIPKLEKIDKIRGMDIIIVTTAKTDEEAREMLTQFGMPFKK